MCVACHLRDPEPMLGYGEKYFRWSRWRPVYNFFYKGNRGEGNPAPWIMLRSKNYGLQIELDFWSLLKFYRNFRKPRIEKDNPVTSYHWRDITFARRVE